MIDMSNPTLLNWSKAAKSLGLDGRNTIQTVGRSGECEACKNIIRLGTPAYVILEPGFLKRQYRRRFYLHKTWQECEAARNEE